MTDPYKLHIKLGDAEFSAEGEQAAVQKQFTAFLEAWKAMPSPPSAGPSPPGNGTGNNQGLPLPPQPGVIDDATLRRIFEKGDGDLVSLRILPKTERRIPDSLILLLYGFRVLAGKSDVSGTDVIAGAAQSGLKIGRVDHAIFVNREMITEGGYRRGKKYGLNTQGVNHALGLIQAML